MSPKRKPLQRAAALLFAALLLTFTGCAAEPDPAGTPGGTDGPGAGQERYQAQFLELFDTVTTVLGYAESEEEFSETVSAFRDELREYHELYDIYNEYEGVNNIRTINDNAGKGPVEVDRRIIDLLLFCRDMYERTDGRTNVMMGSVLSLWHDAREAGIYDPNAAELPSDSALAEAAGHTGFDALVIDADAGTVEITDSEASLDVGAVAKGYAVQRVCEGLPAGLLVSVGGNVCATGPKPDGSDWVVGVQDPDGGASDYVERLSIPDGCIVSSGDYQRYYVVDGERYSHIIDPETLYPPRYWRAVTVYYADSGVSDALSTALFCLGREEGQALLDEFGAEALWIAQDGTIYSSPGMDEFLYRENE